MKKLLLILFVAFATIANAQHETFDTEQIYKSELSDKYLKFEKFKASTTDYELPYLRYCIKKSYNLRQTAYVVSLLSSGLVLISTSEKLRSTDNGVYTRRVAYAGMATALVLYYFSEEWFYRSSIKPVLHENGLGIRYRF